VNPLGDSLPVPLAATAVPLTAAAAGGALQKVASIAGGGQFGFVAKLDWPHATPALMPM